MKQFYFCIALFMSANKTRSFKNEPVLLPFPHRLFECLIALCLLSMFNVWWLLFHFKPQFPLYTPLVFMIVSSSLGCVCAMPSAIFPLRDRGYWVLMTGLMDVLVLATNVLIAIEPSVGISITFKLWREEQSDRFYASFWPYAIGLSYGVHLLGCISWRVFVQSRREHEMRQRDIASGEAVELVWW